MKKMKNYKAAATVEASVLIPIITFVLVAILLQAFYLHDRAVLQSAVCEIAAVGENFTREEEGKAAARRVYDNMKQIRLQIGRELSGTFDVVKNKARASGQATCYFPGFAAQFLGGGSRKITVSWKKNQIETVYWIRLYRGVSTTVKKYKKKLDQNVGEGAAT